MISEPDFAKLHFEQAPLTSLMIRNGHINSEARTMHLLECDLEKFETGSNNNYMKLEPIIKLPLRTARLVSEKNNENSNKCKQTFNIACNPFDDRFEVVNSCNGFLCLCIPLYNIPLVICNPVTGEFIRLPEATSTLLNTARVRIYGRTSCLISILKLMNIR
jgi:hypothetical protein